MDFTGSSTISKTNYYVSPFPLRFSLWHLCSLYTSTVSKMQKLRCRRTAWFALGSAYSSSRSRTISCYQSVTSVHLLDLWIANWLMYAWDCNRAEVLINYNILDISRFPQAAPTWNVGFQVHFQWCILNVSLCSVRSVLNGDFRHHIDGDWLSHSTCIRWAHSPS